MVTSDCGCQEQQQDTKKESRTPCEPCAVPAFCRNHYYTGKLLTARDFRMEQGYFRDKFRLHYEALHGWGVVCGLQVTPHPYCPDRRIVLTSGMAIDPCGREVRVLDCPEFPLPEPPKKKRPQEPCDDDLPSANPKEEHAPPQSDYPEQAGRPPYKNPKPGDPDQHPHLPPGGGPYPPNEPEPCDDGPEPFDLYICIRYHECDDQFAPAPFNECNCNDSSLQPGRTCEGFHLEIYETKPDWWDASIPDDCEAEDCTRIWDRMRKCPHLPKAPCIPLAVIRGFVPGQAVTAADIDNKTRPLLPSVSLIKEAIDCILSKLPAKDYTTIEDFNWSHGAHFHCHEFFKAHVGSKEYPKFLEVRFSRPVVPRSVTTLNFYVMVVSKDDPSAPRHMHIAPAKVEASADNRVFRLLLDQTYAHQHLHNRKFDLYIRIACDKVLDERGDPVDGNLLARREDGDDYVVSFPTGDGTPGGNFESWITVR